MEEAKIVKYIVGETTANEAREVKDWIRSSKENEKLYSELNKTWESSKHIAEEHFDADLAWTKFNSSVVQPKTRVFRLPAVVRYAAAAVILLAAFWGVNTFLGDQTEIQTASNNSEQLKAISLADGSEVRLEKGSIHYPDRFQGKERKVQLSGKAFFKIASNKEQSFLVETANCTVKVLGTQFEVMESDSLILVSVMEGKVAFTTPHGSVLLGKGESGAYQPDKQLLKEVVQDKNRFFYIHRKLDFRNITLEDAVRDIEKHYKVSIKLDPALQDQIINTQFENEELDHLLEVLSVTLNIRITQTKQTIHIDSKP